MKYIYLVSFAFVLVTASQVPVKADLPNFGEARSGIFLAGQPSREGLEQIAKHGVITVVNLRSHDEEGARDESREAAELKMEYVHLPVAPSTYTVEKVAEFASIVSNESNLPVLVHCGSANRAAGMWFAFRVLHENAPVEDALVEARNLGMKKELETTLINFVSAAKMQ